jgi:hypothetical protein
MDNKIIQKFKERFERILGLEKFTKRQLEIEKLLGDIMIACNKEGNKKDIENQINELFKRRYMVTTASMFHYNMNKDVYDYKVKELRKILKAIN